jgi:chlorite dismutase
MMKLRESEASAYTELDTPIFTCRRRGLPEILRNLG